MNGAAGWLAHSGVVQGVIIGLTLGYLSAVLILNAVARRRTQTVNGWSMIRDAGQPGHGLLVRAALQKALPLVNLWQEAAYWTADADSAGAPLTGARTYVLHFAAGQAPPNAAFWSLTATDPGGYRPRASSGSASLASHAGMRQNPDGSIDVLVSAQPPGDAGTGGGGNWLQAPPGRFKLMLRVYLPAGPILDASYRVPPLVRVEP